jgi:hypothetical protein
MDGRLKQYLFDEQMEKVEAQLTLIETEEVSPLESEAELEDLIEFTKWVLDNAGILWNAAEYDKQLMGDLEPPVPPAFSESSTTN